VKDLAWMVYYHNSNAQEMQTFNVFHHAGFSADVKSLLRKYKEKKPFSEELRRSLLYYYWSKCEWEIIIGPWCGGRDTKEIKVDVYSQVMNNWEIFVDYVWNTKRKQKE